MKGISAISISAVVPCQRQGGYHLWKRVSQTTAIAYGSVCRKPQFNTDECSGFEAGTSVSYRMFHKQGISGQHCTGQFISSDQLNALATTKNNVYSTQFVATRIRSRDILMLLITSKQWRSSFILYAQSYLSNIIISVYKDNICCPSSKSVCLDISVLVLLWKRIIRLQILQGCSMIK